MEPTPSTELDAILAALPAKSVTARGTGCPDETVWFEVAGRIAEPEIERRMLTHAAGCDYCGAQLREAVRDLSDDRADSPAPKVVQIRPVSKAVLSWRAWAAAAVILLAAAGTWIVVRPAWLTSRASNLLAESQREARYTAFRLADAPYARTAVSRSATSEASKLVEAQDLAQQAGADLLAARIQLAAGRANAEEAALLTAARATGETPELDNDVGIAAAQQGDNAALQSSLDAFDRALARNPSFAPALYNKALVLSMLGRRPDACGAVAAFLGVEKDPGWRADLESTVSCSR